MIRLILIGIFLLLFFIVSLPLFVIEWIIGKFNPDLKNRSSQAIVQTAFKIIIFLAGTKLTVKGFDRIPKDEAVLYVVNHNSFFDTVITYALAPGLTGYVAKKEILRVPILRTWMKFLHCLFLDRENIKEGLKTILLGIEYVRQGISICIFPEGTRNKDNPAEPLPFKEGSLKIAEKSGCKVIPVCLTHTADIWENHFPFIKKAHVTLEYGEPIDLKSLPKEEKKFSGAYTRKIIADMYAKNIDM